MRKTLLYLHFFCVGLFLYAQETFNVNYNGSAVNLTTSTATVNDPITIKFTDIDPVNNFYTQGLTAIYIYAGVETSSGTWKYVPATYFETSDANRTANLSGGSYNITFTPKTLLNIPDGTLVKSLQFKFYNQHGGGGNNETTNLNIDLVDDVTGNTLILGGGKITVSPKKPTRTEPVTITFDATSTDLAGASKVYLHSGVATDKPSSTSFNVVKGNWGQDDGLGEMTPNGTDKWTITLPNADSYFGLTAQQDAFALNFLFRSADGSKNEGNGGANYHADLKPGNYFLLNNDLTTYKPFYVKQNEAYSITTTASGSANWKIEETSSDYSSVIATIATGTGQNITQNITLTDLDVRHYYKTTYDFGGEIKEKTFSLQAYGGITYEAIPTGLNYGVNYDASDLTKATVVFHTPVKTTYYGYDKSKDENQYNIGLYSIGIGTTAEKKIVHLRGDFNNWVTNSTSAMKCGKWTTDNKCEVWWQTITGLEAGKEYVYQFLVDGTLPIGDPYTTKVSDPWNDKNISSSVYPNLIQNPNTDNIAGVLQTNQPAYQWEMPDFKFMHNDAHNRLNIYELHFRDFTSEGTYKAATAKLDYLKEMGINCIHVMPVSEFENNDSWGYNPSYYFAADKAYGPANDLKQFIDEAHKRGIAVVNDMVLNHAFGSNSMARLYWDSAANKPTADNPWFFRDHQAVRSQDGWWGSDWNHTSEHTQKMVDDILKYWMTEFKFDGFRFDFTKGFSHLGYIGGPGDDWASAYNSDRIGLLRRMVIKMRTSAATLSKNPIIIFEHLANSSENAELAGFGVLHWSGVSHHNDMKEFMLGNNGAGFYNSGAYPTQGFGINANWISYQESHDEERQGYEVFNYAKGIGSLTGAAKTELAINRLKLGTAFNLLMPGPRMLWMWEEMGYDVSINENGRTGKKPTHWEYLEDAKRKELQRLISTIFQLRDAHEIHKNVDWGNIGATDMSARRMRLNDDYKHVVIVVGNPSPDYGQSVTPNYLFAGKWYKYNGNPAIDGEEYTVTNASSDTFYLGPNEVYVLTNFPVSIDRNDIKINPYNGSCEWTKGFPTYNAKDDIHVYCDYTLSKDIIIPQSTIEVHPNIKFTLDKTKKLCVGQTNVFGTLYLDEGSHLRIGDETCTFTTP